MQATEGARIINSMIDSLQTNSNQFHLNINTTGQKISTQGGGSGLKVNVVGGGPGSTTIGNSVSAGGSNITISQERGKQEMSRQTQALLETLREISRLLEQGQENRAKIEELHRSIENNWVPGVIATVIATIITLVFA